VAVPYDPPFSLDRMLDRYGRGLDALAAFARRLMDAPEGQWPAALLLLGDQVYADDVPEATRRFIEARRDTSRPPGESLAPVDRLDLDDVR
jgi:hypothetical protein